jgi:RNA polymerase sigma factor (sigma-70 family)
MAGLGTFLKHLGDPLTTSSDAELLSAFLRQHSTSAFEVIVRRHGGLVMRICQRELYQHSDAEDAFQATFLTLARKAHSIRQENHMASWLAGVARRIARRLAQQLRLHRQRLQTRHEQRRSPSPRPNDDHAWWDEEQRHLPAEYRQVIDLCLIQGLTREEAAAQLGQSPSAIHGLLYRARLKLKKQLLQRGAVASAALVATQANAAIDKLAQPLALAAVELLRQGSYTNAIITPTAARLTHEMTSRWQVPVLLAGVALTLGIGWWGWQLSTRHDVGSTAPLALNIIQPTVTLPTESQPPVPIPDQLLEQLAGQALQSSTPPQQELNQQPQPQIMNLPQQQRQTAGRQNEGQPQTPFQSAGPGKLASPGYPQLIEAIALPTSTGVLHSPVVKVLPRRTEQKMGALPLHLSVIQSEVEYQAVLPPSQKPLPGRELGWDMAQHPMNWNTHVLVVVVLEESAGEATLHPQAKPWVSPGRDGVGHVLLSYGGTSPESGKLSAPRWAYVMLKVSKENLKKIAVTIWRPGESVDAEVLIRE